MQLAKVRIIVADDNPAFLQKLVSLLSAEFDIVATAGDGESAMRAIHSHKPDLAVLDLEMPLLNGIQITQQLGKNNTRAVICSTETDPEIVQAARQAGALAYVFKLRIERDLILALKSALDCKFFVSPGPK